MENRLSVDRNFYNFLCTLLFVQQKNRVKLTSSSSVNCCSLAQFWFQKSGCMWPHWQNARPWEFFIGKHDFRMRCHLSCTQPHHGCQITLFTSMQLSIIPVKLLCRPNYNFEVNKEPDVSACSLWYIQEIRYPWYDAKWAGKIKMGGGIYTISVRTMAAVGREKKATEQLCSISVRRLDHFYMGSLERLCFQATFMNQAFTEHQATLVNQAFTEHQATFMNQAFTEYQATFMDQAFTEHQATFMNQAFTDH